jgi:hypothetical protein
MAEDFQQGKHMNVKDTLTAYKIPHATICGLIGIHASEMSAYLRNRRYVSEAKATRIEQAVEDVKYALDCYAQAQAECGGPSLSFNLRDVERLREFIEFVQQERAQLTDAETKLKQQEQETLAVLDDLMRDRA